MSPDTTPKSSSRRTAASRSKASGTSEKNSAVQPSVTETISPSVPPQADIQEIPVDPPHPPEQLGEEGTSVIIQPHSQLSPPANRLIGSLPVQASLANRRPYNLSPDLPHNPLNHPLWYNLRTYLRLSPSLGIGLLLPIVNRR